MAETSTHLVNGSSQASHSQNTVVDTHEINITNSESAEKSQKNHSKRKLWLIALGCISFTVVCLVILIHENSSESDGTDNVDKLEKEILWKDLAKHIKNYMNDTFDPCENFYEYACSGWNDIFGSSKDKPLGVLDFMTVRNFKTLQKVFDTKNVTNISKSEQKARDFYYSCVNQDPDQLILEALLTLRNFNGSLNMSGLNNNTNFEDYLALILGQNSSRNLQHVRNLEGTSPNESNKQIAWNCLMETMSYFPDVTGLMFVHEVLPKGQDPHVYDIFSDIKRNYIDLVKTFIREDFKDKRLILSKLSNVPLWNGYPQSITEDLDARYDSVNISKDSYKSNKLILSSTTLDYMRLLTDFAYRETKIIKANAFYDRHLDAVILTAGIIRRPVYGANFPNVMNYAGLGFTIGHEMSHAFYNYYYNCENCLRSGKDPKACLEDFYGSMSIDGNFVNGSSTLEENFSDIFGFQVAYAAYKSSSSKIKETLPGLAHFTKKQLFFITHTQNFCFSMGSKENQKDYLEEQLKNDTHSPKSLRILGMYSNSQEFAQAFNCPVGSAYNPEKKCNIF